MNGNFPSPEEIALARKCTEVSRVLTSHRGLWKDSLPALGPVLLALERRVVYDLSGLLKPVSGRDFGDLETLRRIVTYYKKPAGFWDSFKDTRKTDVTEWDLNWYRLFLEYQYVALGKNLEDFASLVDPEFTGDLEALRAKLLGLLNKKSGLMLYSDPVKIIEAYKFWEQLIRDCPGLLSIADTICGELERLGDFDAKLAAKIQKELNDKLKQLYNVNEVDDSVTLNDVTAVLTDIKSLPELDPLLKKTV